MKIIELFYSIQGEGIQMGLPTFFVRTSGCNLRCAWCDTKYAYYGGKELSPKRIVEEAMKYPIKRVSITGGEPLLQNDLNDLIEQFLDEDYEVLIETNGSLSVKKIPLSKKITISLDIKCPSSGMSNMMDYSNLKLLKRKDQLKFVIKDIDFSIDTIEKYRPKTNIIFQPVGGKNIKRLVEWTLGLHHDIRVMPQLHKLIWGKKKGV
jgi:7-carboxy-7-deazaguanine synthase